MRERHVGYLVVAEPDPPAGVTQRPVGVLTDRDIVIAVVAQQADPRHTLVKDVMTRDPVVLKSSDSLTLAVQCMRQAGVRRMPVIGSVGELMGVLSLDEVLDMVSNELVNLAGAIRNERRIEASTRA